MISEHAHFDSGATTSVRPPVWPLRCRVTRHAAASHPSRSQHAAAYSWTQLPDACRHIMVCCMDRDTRAAWRLINRQACQDVYEATLQLSERRRVNSTPCMMMIGRFPPKSTKPPLVFLKCPHLQRLECWESLRDLVGLPQRLQVLHLTTCVSVLDWSPLLQCSMLRELHLGSVDPHDSFFTALRALTTLHTLSIARSHLRQPAQSGALASSIGCYAS